MNELNEQQKDALRQVTQKTDAVMSREQTMSFEQLETYAQLRAQEEPEQEELTQLHSRLLEHMLVLEDSDLEGLEALPEDLLLQRQQKLDELHSDADRSGTDKMKNDFFGRKKRAARDRLEHLKQLHATVESISRLGTEANSEELHTQAKESISLGRHWANPLRAAMNHFSLGSHSERHKAVEFPHISITHQVEVSEGVSVPQELTLSPQPLEIKTDEGTLCGSIYRPGALKDEQTTGDDLRNSIDNRTRTRALTLTRIQQYRNDLLGISERLAGSEAGSEELLRQKALLETRISQNEDRVIEYDRQLAEENQELEAFDRLVEQQRSTDSGKLVIFFSGSGGPNASMVRSVAQTYLSAGASVLSMDYRGFGTSRSEKIRKDSGGNDTREKTGTHLCEASIYKDGMDIYNYAVKELHYKPSDIILHGFSLGGAVASKVAADIAQKNAASDVPVSEEQKLGGIVLHSSIDTLYNTSKRLLVGAAGTLGWMGSGGYNTASHMRRLHRFDPAIPVHYRGGDSTEDHLSLDITSLHLDPQAAFANTDTFYGNDGHMLNDDSGNMTYGTESLKKLAQTGRATNLRG